MRPLNNVPSLATLLPAVMLLAAACGGDSTAPGEPAGVTPLSPASWHAADAGPLAQAITDSAAFTPAFSQGLTGSSSGRGNGQVVACERRVAATRSAVIGPRGGILIVGPNALIVPPGALLVPTIITADVVAGPVAELRFQPHGLVFRRAAGLVMNTTGCDIPRGESAVVVYVDDAGTILERLPSFYGPAWHAVAAPLRHFSGYSIAL